MSPAEIATTLHALAVLIAVELTIRWVELPRLAGLLGSHVDLTPTPTAAEPMKWEELPARARRQLAGTYLVAGAWPFAEGPCLRRSLVLGHMLRRHDLTLRLGVIGEGDEINAHSWVEIDGRPLEDVSGYGVFQSAVGA